MVFTEVGAAFYKVWLLFYQYHNIYDHCLQAGPYDSLKDVALKILKGKVATVPITHSSAQDGSFPQLLHLATLSEILKCKSFFCRRPRVHDFLLV